MKKESIFILSLFVILFICGCGKEESKSITGTYNDTNSNSNGYIKLYENGSCNWREYSENPMPGFGHYSDTDTDNCSYTYNDTEIIIKTYTYNTSCTFGNNTIDCGTRGVYSK